MLLTAPEWLCAVRVLLYFQAAHFGPGAAPRPFRSVPAKTERKENAGWELPSESIGAICPMTMPPPLTSFG